MSTPTARRVLRLTFLVISVCLGGATSLYAQTDACQPAGKKGDGDDLKCRIGLLLDKQQTFLDKFEEHTNERCAAGECDRLKKGIDKAKAQHGRAANAHGRATPKDYEDLTVKGNGKRKSQGGGNSGASGDQSTQAQEDEEPVPDPELGEDVADGLDEVIDAIDDASTALDEEQSSGAALFAADAATGKFEASYGYGRTERTGAVMAAAAFGVFRASHTVAEVVNQVCGQTVVAAGFGGNTRAGCVPLFVVTQVLEHAYELLQFLDDDINDAEIEGAYERAGQVYDKVTELQVSTGNAETQIGVLRSDLAAHDTAVRDELAEVMAEVRANQQHLKKVMAVQLQIIRLLLQPDGKRTVDPNVLTCTGDNCPVVLKCPGTECTSPVK